MSKKRSGKNENVSLRIDAQLRADVEALAKADDERPMAAFIRKVLREYVRSHKPASNER